MPNPAFFKEAFDQSAINGVIGDPNGLEANGYLRVSSDQQANEGRSGLPRQIMHVHEAGLREGYCIPWERIYADDESGFTLERPALNQLINDLNDPKAPRVVVIEHLDRLSRNADWHQGYLLHLFANKFNAKTIFWKQFSSRVERMVLGAISQDGMERSKELMNDGRRLKAKSGRVTVGPKVSYGYKKVDASGKVSDKTSRETYYAVVDEEARIVTYVYEALVYEGKTLYRIATELQQRHQPPRNFAKWAVPFLWSIVRNPVYKGKFAAYRWATDVEEVMDHNTGRIKKIRRTYERPESEWIYVDVPAIVSEELWEEANRVMMDNRQMAKRNAKHEYLLTGLLYCAICGRSWTGQSNGHDRAGAKKGKDWKPYLYYRCASRVAGVASYTARNVERCEKGIVGANALEGAVWNIIREVSENPQLLTDYLDEKYSGNENQKIADRIAYLRQEITGFEKADKKDYDLYQADGFTAEEYSERHKDYKAKIEAHKKTIAGLEKTYISREMIEAKKQSIRERMAKIRALRVGENPSFELKRSLVRFFCRKIIIDLPNNSFTIEGEIRGTWPITDGRGPQSGEFGGPNVGNAGFVSPSAS